MMKLFIVGYNSIDPSDWAPKEEPFYLVVAEDIEQVRRMLSFESDSALLIPITEIPMDEPFILVDSDSLLDD